MDELISKQDAINALKRAETLARAFGYHVVLETVRELPSAEPRWIPCSERLPEEDGVYLVTTSKGQVQVHVFNHNGNSEEYWMRCNKAWMPLPESWKGDAK